MGVGLDARLLGPLENGLDVGYEDADVGKPGGGVDVALLDDASGLFALYLHYLELSSGLVFAEDQDVDVERCAVRETDLLGEVSRDLEAFHFGESDHTLVEGEGLLEVGYDHAEIDGLLGERAGGFGFFVLGEESKGKDRYKWKNGEELLEHG